jgi:hypothetical protein
MSVAILFLTFLIANTIVALVPYINASSKSPYDSGYDHGCDDADISDPDDRYINQPEKGPSFHTNEFMNGYNDGYDVCSNSRGDEDDRDNADTKLPLCDGSYQDCITEEGYVCEAGSTDDECELNGYYCIEGEGCGNFEHGICEDCNTNDEEESSFETDQEQQSNNEITQHNEGGGDIVIIEQDQSQRISEETFEEDREQYIESDESKGGDLTVIVHVNGDFPEPARVKIFNTGDAAWAYSGDTIVFKHQDIDIGERITVHGVDQDDDEETAYGVNGPEKEPEEFDLYWK